MNLDAVSQISDAISLILVTPQFLGTNGQQATKKQYHALFGG